MMKSAIVRVFGGLGNQMFIYAFARALSEKANIPVFLETRTGFVRDHYKRNYKLGAFDIKLKKCSPRESLYFPLSGRSELLTRLFVPNSEKFLEPDIGYESFSIPETGTGQTVFFSGYWQDERYFAEIRSMIKEDFFLPQAQGKRNRDMGEEMKKRNSIAIHVRRKEYVDKLDSGYFMDAIFDIKTRVENPVFYIFSDEIAWCRQHIIDDAPMVYVDHNGNDDLSEFWLMSQAKHFIISNSSFSWWSSWLGEYPEKIIISPPHYINSGKHD